MRTVICACAMAFALAAFGGGERAIPSVIHHSQPNVSYPLWVSEQAALDERGRLRLELFQEDNAARLTRALERNAAGDCRTFLTQPPLEHHNPESTLDDVVRYSRAIVSGTVTAAERGFYRGTPGILLALAGTETLKATVPVNPGGGLHVFIPEATIETSAGPICSTMRAALPSIPKPGDSILVFVYGSPGGDEATIAEVNVARHLLVQPRGEKRLLPNRLAGAVGDREQFRDVAQRVREQTRRESVINRRHPATSPWV